MNIIIIGATSGIGRALFEKYAAADNRIGIVGRRTHLLNELRQEHPDTAITVMADITKQDEITQAIDALHSELKDIDLAIVCSGTGDINASLDYAVERPTIDTNVMGWTFVVDTLYNIFEQQDHGHLVAITSAGGLRGEPMAPAYSASKAYQINYMESPIKLLPPFAKRNLKFISLNVGTFSLSLIKVFRLCYTKECKTLWII